MKKISLILLVLSGVVLTAQTKIETKVTHLLDIMGSAKSMKTTYDYMIDHYKKTAPQVPASYWEEAAKLVNYNSLIKKLVPVYTKHFSEKEIDDLIIFYSSDVGKKTVEKTPLILQESMEIGQIWGAELAQQLEKNISNSKTPPPPPMTSKRK